MEDKNKNKTSDDYVKDLLSLVESDRSDEQTVLKEGLAKAMLRNERFIIDISSAFIGAACKNANIANILFLMKDIIYKDYAEKGKMDELKMLIIDAYRDFEDKDGIIITSGNDISDICNVLDNLFRRFPNETLTVLATLIQEKDPNITMENIRKAIENCNSDTSPDKTKELS